MNATVNVEARFQVVGDRGQIANFVDNLATDLQAAIDDSAFVSGVIVQYLGEDRQFVKVIKSIDWKGWQWPEEVE